LDRKWLSALGSRPSEWDGTERDWSEPTVSGRIGLRPSPAWAVGMSLSSGPYLRHAADSSLRPGDDTADFRETVIAADARWSWRHLELWAEMFAARFQVPFGCRRCGVHTDDADLHRGAEGKRYDAGDKLGFLKATVEFALKREDLGKEFGAYLRELKF
jgi:hypothetical protein